MDRAAESARSPNGEDSSLTVSRCQILAGAAANAAVAAIPAAAIAGVLETAPMSIDAWITENFEWPTVPIDHQTFFDGRIDWTFYARRREWIGIDR